MSVPMFRGNGNGIRFMARTVGERRYHTTAYYEFLNELKQIRWSMACLFEGSNPQIPELELRPGRC